MFFHIETNNLSNIPDASDSVAYIAGNKKFPLSISEVYIETAFPLARDDKKSNIICSVYKVLRNIISNFDNEYI